MQDLKDNFMAQIAQLLLKVVGSWNMQRYTGPMTKQNMTFFSLLPINAVADYPYPQRLSAAVFVRLPQMQLRMSIA
ncbi:hypothetical protein CZ787_07785 [Halomonas citrativorans]|uniref:Uncharacterized protein n=1 Tax=Halomonas citrativorans TaxID=2742612 RepID=A0A1R4HXM7_9GAMM|nr:hypothetical protein [Halomonas citrativorans]SJN12302.1 hypothetical protein CZ787_07785 [Halomonas citrativorans]